MTDNNSFSFVVHDDVSDTKYHPWTDGHAVGFRVERDGNDIGFVYLNPSIAADEHSPDVFVYEGVNGDPAQDGAVVYIDTLKLGDDQPRYCRYCGERIIDDPDGSPDVLVHDRQLGDTAFDLDENHVPVPDDKELFT